MAKRMLTTEILCENRFLALPRGAQLLYVLMCLYADDDGLCGYAKMLVGLCKAEISDFFALEKAGFIYAFESGVIYIRDFRVMNRIPKKYYRKSVFKRELSEIEAGRIPPRGNLW